jgi:pyruvate kinase
MVRIVARAEQEEMPAVAVVAKSAHASQETDRASLIAAALRAASALMPMACAVTYTTSGTSALRVAQERIALPHIGLTPHVETARRLCLAWGVQPCISQDAASVEGMIDSAVSAAKSMGYYHARKPMAVVAGLPFATAGSTNLLRFVWPQALVEAPPARAAAPLMQPLMKTPYFATAGVE